MAQSDCPLCSGTGWRLVERVDANEQAERVVERKNVTLGASTAPAEAHLGRALRLHRQRSRPRSLARARIPRRYEHCDFENFDTDLWEGGPEAAAWNRSLAQARLVVRSLRAKLSGRRRNRSSADGAVRRGQDASGRGRAARS